MAAANCFRVTIRQSMYGQEFQNVLHFSGPSPDPLQMATLAQEIETSWVQRVRTIQQSQIRYFAVTIRLLESQFATFTRPMNFTGTRSGGDQEHTFTSHVIRIRTPLIGRHGRGRVYVGGLRNDSTQNGFLNTSYLTDWTTQLNLIAGVFCTGGTSTFRLGVTRKQSPTDNWLESNRLEVATVIGIQRRRQVGIGI